MTSKNERLTMWKNREEMLKWAEDNMSKEFRDKVFEIRDEIHSNWTHKMTFGTYPRNKQELYKHIFLRVEVEKRKEDLLKMMNKEFLRLCPEMYKTHQSEGMNNYI
jgi:hypothetical protein